MDLDNKIIKYKLKKKKLINKINDLLIKKKKDNIDSITQTLNNTMIFSEIIKKIIAGNDTNNDIFNNDISNTNNNFIFFIVVGFYSVGKSTLIEYIENLFGDTYTKSKLNIFNINDINIINNIIDSNINSNTNTNTNTKLSNEKKIIYIEILPDYINELYNKILKYDIYILYLIPSSILIYKNRIINKFFNSTDKSLGDIIKKINLNKESEQKQESEQELKILVDFNSIISENNSTILTDNDFNLLNPIISNSYEYVKSYQFEQIDNLNIKKLITKFYF